MSAGVRSLDLCIFAAGSGGIILAILWVCGAPSAELPLPITGLYLPLLDLFYYPLVGVPVALCLFIVLFTWWVWPVCAGRPFLTKRAWFGLLGVALGSGAWYAVNWQTANTWRRPSHAIGCALLDGILVLIILGIGFAAHTRRSAALSVLTRGIAVFWAASYGFPYFGELL